MPIGAATTQRRPPRGARRLARHIPAGAGPAGRDGDPVNEADPPSRPDPARRFRRASTVGTEVRPDQVLAHHRRPGAPRRVPLAGPLHADPEHIAGLLVAAPGSMLAEGDAIARTEEGREVRAPVEGLLLGVASSDGSALLSPLGDEEPVIGHVSGTRDRHRGWRHHHRSARRADPGRGRDRVGRPRRAGGGRARSRRGAARRGHRRRRHGQDRGRRLASVRRDADPGAGHGRRRDRAGRRAGQGAARLRGDPAPAARGGRADRLVRRAAAGGLRQGRHRPAALRLVPCPRRPDGQPVRRRWAAVRVRRASSRPDAAACHGWGSG